MLEWTRQCERSHKRTSGAAATAADGAAAH
jgi:hypothetical protein